MDGKTKEQFRGIREAIQSGKVFQPMGMAAAKEKIQKHLNDNSKPEKDAARKTAEYWKAEHLAGNAIIETLNARVAELEAQIAGLRAANARLQAWHDAVMGQEVVGTYYTSINRRQWFPGKTPFASIPHPVIIRPQPLAKE